MRVTFEDIKREMDGFLALDNRIPNMSIEELPEVLVHRFPLIREHARKRLEELKRDEA